jgi:hypothetical protein
MPNTRPTLLSSGGRLLSSELDRDSFRRSQLRFFLPPTLFFLSAALALWSPRLAVVLWYLIAVLAFIGGPLSRPWTQKTS